MTTLHQAEARAEAAEAEVERLQKLLKAEGERDDRIRKAREEAFVDRTRDLREQLARLGSEHAAERSEAARLDGELEAARAEIAALKQALKPPVEEQLLAVRWLKDAPPGGASIAGKVYQGAAGDVVLLPEGAAAVLGDQSEAARYVRVLGAAGLTASYRHLTHQIGRPGTVAEMRARAAELEKLAADLERVEHLEAEQAQRPAVGLLTNEELLRRDQQAQQQAKEREQGEATGRNFTPAGPAAAVKG